MNNMNIDENTMKNIKNMVDNGNISDAISQISPEMMQNFSKMLSNQNSQSTQNEQKSEREFDSFKSKKSLKALRMLIFLVKFLYFY